MHIFFQLVLTVTPIGASADICEKDKVCHVDFATAEDAVYTEYKCVCQLGFQGDGIDCEGTYIL